MPRLLGSLKCKEVLICTSRQLKAEETEASVSTVWGYGHFPAHVHRSLIPVRPFRQRKIAGKAGRSPVVEGLQLR